MGWLQISIELDLDTGRVLNHWAVCKIAVSSALRDDELEEALRAKVSETQRKGEKGGAE